MNCPRCKSAIIQSFGPDSIIVCPGCGARLMTRAAALRSQGKLKPADLTPAPRTNAEESAGASSPGAVENPFDPSLETPSSPADAFPLDPAATDLPLSATVPSATTVHRAGSGEPGFPAEAAAGTPGPATMDVLLHEMQLLHATQDEILALLRQGGSTRAPHARGAAPETSSVLQPVRSLRRKTVLLIDDDPETCGAAKTELEQADVPVRVATEGNAALRMMAEEKPDVIALELGLEGEMGGKDMVNLIKATMEWIDIPIVLWTAEPVTTQKEARLLHGADEVVQKASGPAALVTRVITVFRRT